MYDYVCVCVCVCIHLCSMYVCEYMSCMTMYAYVCICIHLCMYVSTYAYACICIICVFAYINILCV